MMKRAFLLLVFILFVVIINAFLNPIPKKEIIERGGLRYGISYSFEQAAWYGLDGREAYIDLIANNKFDWVRLSFFWDQMVDFTQNGEQSFNSNFDDLKFATEEAGKRDIKVIVAIGVKTPYYPEYHWPEQIRKKVKFGDRIDVAHPVAGDILEIDKKVIEELKGYENISYWQVENEPLLANINNWKIDKSLIKAEIAQVRVLDPKKRPIIINHVGPSVFDNQWKDLSDLLQEGDVFGVNAYFKTQGVDLVAFKLFGKEIHVSWPQRFVWPVQSWGIFSPDFEGMRREIEAKGIEFWILEMQAEPFIKNLEDARRDNSYFQAKDVVEAQKYLETSGVKNIGFWGSPFWLYRKRLGDNSWTETISEMVN